MSRVLVVALGLTLSVGIGCGSKGKQDCVGPGGVAMKDGDTVPAGDGCNHCICMDGRLAYTLMQCPPVPQPADSVK